MFSQTGQSRLCNCDGKILIQEGCEFDFESRYNFSGMPRRAAAVKSPNHAGSYIFRGMYS